MTTPGTADFALLDALAELERSLVEALALRPCALPPELARAEGVLRGQRVAIETRAYASRPVAYARFATITGPDLAIGNALLLPDPATPLPILGADLVALGRDRALIAADLSPTAKEGPERDLQLDRLGRAAAAWPALSPGGELPGFCAAFFSPFAIYTRFPRSERDAACGALLSLGEVFIELARGSTPCPPRAAEVAGTIERYVRAHRTEDKGLSMLEKMFGAAWASRYLDEVLFPAPACARV